VVLHKPIHQDLKTFTFYSFYAQRKRIPTTHYQNGNTHSTTKRVQSDPRLLPQNRIPDDVPGVDVHWHALYRNAAVSEEPEVVRWGFHPSAEGSGPQAGTDTARAMGAPEQHREDECQVFLGSGEEGQSLPAPELSELADEPQALGGERGVGYQRADGEDDEEDLGIMVDVLLSDSYHGYYDEPRAYADDQYPALCDGSFYRGGQDRDEELCRRMGLIVVRR